MAEDDAEARPREAALMNHLSCVHADAEAAMALIQDDSRVTGASDVRAIAALLRRMKSRILEAEALVGASGSYARVNPDGIDEEILGRPRTR